MRQRRRYIAFELRGARAYPGEINQALDESLPTGGPKLVLYDQESRKGLIRCGHLELDELKRALSKLDEIGGREVAFNILGVSGTIRAAKRKFLLKGESHSYLGSDSRPGCSDSAVFRKTE